MQSARPGAGRRHSSKGRGGAKNVRVYRPLGASMPSPGRRAGGSDVSRPIEIANGPGDESKGGFTDMGDRSVTTDKRDDLGQADRTVVRLGSLDGAVLSPLPGWVAIAAGNSTSK